MKNIFSKALQNYQNDSAPESNLKQPQPWMQNFLGTDGGGAQISERAALSISAFYSGVNIISNHTAGLPLDIVKRDGGGNTEDPDHYLNEKLKYQPNKNISAYHFKKLLVLNSLVFGNGYARIERDPLKDEIKGIYLEKPQETDIYRNKEDGTIYYKFKDNPKMYPAYDVIHVFDFSLNGYAGLSVLEAGARKQFSNHMNVAEFENRYFKNNASIGGVLSTDQSLGNDEKTVNQVKSSIRSEFDQIYSGAENSFKTAILEGDWHYEKIEVNASDAQLIERSKATVEDIARWLSMPLSYLGHSDSQSYASKEQEAITYVQNCLNPHLKILENEIRNKLFLEKEKEQGYKVIFDTKQLVRSSAKDTGEFLAAMTDRGIMDLNEARDFLDIDSKEGLDVHLQQKNMKILGEEDE